MAHPYVSKHKANHLCAAILLIGLAIVAYLQRWWPDIILALGCAFVARQIFLAKWYDAILLFIVAVGIFCTFFYNLSVLPVLFLIAGIYLLFRETAEPADEDEDEEDLQREIEEQK